MDELVVIGKGVLGQLGTGSQASSTPSRRKEYERRRLINATVRHRYCWSPVTVSHGVGGLVYGNVAGKDREMEDKPGKQPTPLKPIYVGVCAMKTKVWFPH